MTANAAHFNNFGSQKLAQSGSKPELMERLWSCTRVLIAAAVGAVALPLIALSGLFFFEGATLIALAFSSALTVLPLCFGLSVILAGASTLFVAAGFLRFASYALFDK